MRREKIILLVALVVVALVTAVAAVVSQHPAAKKAQVVEAQPTPQLSYDATLKQSNSLVAQKQYPAAVKLWQTFIVQAPKGDNAKRANDQLAAVYELQGNYDGEVAAYQAAAKAATPTFLEENGLGNAALKAFFALSSKSGFDHAKAKAYLNTAVTAFAAAVPLAPDAATAREARGQQSVATTTLTQLK